MPRFNNGMPGRNVAGFRMGNGMGNGMGQGCGTGGGRGRGRGANCQGSGPGFGFGAGNIGGIGQAPAGQRNPGLFRRFCLGLTDPSGATINTRRGRILSAINDLQRQINALKNATDK